MEGMSTLKRLVIDLETTSKVYLKHTANFLINKIVAYSWLDLSSNIQEVCYLETEADLQNLLNKIAEADILIGHNISFDLLFLWKYPEIQDWIKQGGMLWDTMLAEYMLSGQMKHYPSLREIAVSCYNCPKRNKLMESFWERGVDTSKIPKYLVMKDVKEDVKDTAKVFLGQIDKAEHLNMDKLILRQGDGILATTEIEFNGMQVGKEEFLKNKQALQEEVEHVNTQLNDLIHKYWPMEAEEFNLQSPTQLSKLLFGGEISYKIKRQIGTYKTGKNKGQIKYKNEEVRLLYEGIGASPSGQQKANGTYSTDEKSLENVLKPLKEELTAHRIVSLILEKRKLDKQLSTYYISLEESLDEHNIVRAHYSHVATDTGRLGCSRPNLQNQPKPPSKVMKHFCSRFANGAIVSADYKQIEIVVQAELSGDYKYKQDVLNGVDFHSKRLSLKEGKGYDEVIKLVASDPIWKEKRSKVKGFSFARAYGAGTYKIAEQSGLTVEEVRILIQKEEEEYPDLKAWQDRLKGQVSNSGFYQSFLGRIWKFKKWPAPEWQREKGVYETYKPQEIINYPIQGTATADIVLLMLGKFFRENAIYKREKYLLINTVHDSIVLDCKQEYLKEAKEDLKILENWPEYSKQVFDYTWKLPTKIDINIGTTWFECY